MCLEHSLGLPALAISIAAALSSYMAVGSVLVMHISSRIYFKCLAIFPAVTDAMNSAFVEIVATVSLHFSL